MKKIVVVRCVKNVGSSLDFLGGNLEPKKINFPQKNLIALVKSENKIERWDLFVLALGLLSIS